MNDAAKNRQKLKELQRMDPVRAKAYMHGGQAMVESVLGQLQEMRALYPKSCHPGLDCAISVLRQTADAVRALAQPPSEQS